jgi:hypothetical protein
MTHIIQDIISGDYLVSDKGVHTPQQERKLAFIERYSLHNPEPSIDIYPDKEYGKIVYRNIANDLQLHLGLVTQINRSRASLAASDALEEVSNIHTLPTYIQALKFTQQYVLELVMTKVGEQTDLPIDSAGITLLPYGRTLWVELDFLNRSDCTISIVLQGPLARRYHKYGYRQMERVDVSSHPGYCRLSHAASPQSKSIISRLELSIPHNGWVTEGESNQVLSIQVLADVISAAVQDLLTHHEGWVHRVAEGYSRQFATPIRQVQKKVLGQWLTDEEQSYITFDRNRNVLLTMPVTNTSLLPDTPVSLEIQYDLDGDNHHYEVSIQPDGKESSLVYEKKMEGLPTLHSVETVVKELMDKSLKTLDFLS